MRLPVRDAVKKCQEFQVALLDVVDRPTSQETLAEETDLAFNPAFFVTPAKVAQSKLCAKGSR